MSRAGPQRGVDSVFDPHTAPSENEAIGIIAVLLDWIASPTHAPLVEDWPIRPREQKTAENFTTAAERFVLAHDIAHIVHRHLIADSAKVNVAQMTLVELDTRPIEQEIIADETAAYLKSGL
jgi:hypothetical protein